MANKNLKKYEIKTKNAFTLIEIMVVVALIGIISLVGLNFNFNKRADLEKIDRINNKFMEIIDNAKINSITGKGIYVGTTPKILINPDLISINVSTGQIITRYFSGNISGFTQIGTGEVLKYPFYYDDKYEIKSFSGSKKDGTSTLLKELQIDFAGDSISLSGTDISGNPVSDLIQFQIDLGYRKNFKSLKFDKRNALIKKVGN
ncbi:MAG: type II secretion system protein [Candidatus Gracilibacteria bacterium]|nr:type II secretion system protein [Candidatus Gracilibacteria bacterium]